MAIVTIRMMATVSCECGNITGRSWWPISEAERTLCRSALCPVCLTVEVAPHTFATINKPAWDDLKKKPV